MVAEEGALLSILCFFQVLLYLSYHVLHFLEHFWSNHESINRVIPTNWSRTLSIVQYFERAQLIWSLVPIFITYMQILPSVGSLTTCSVLFLHTCGAYPLWFGLSFQFVHLFVDDNLYWNSSWYWAQQTIPFKTWMWILRLYLRSLF